MTSVYLNTCYLSGNKANSCTPTKVGEELGRIVEVAATHYNHISAAMSQDSRVYMWGQCRGQVGEIFQLTQLY